MRPFCLFNANHIEILYGCHIIIRAFHCIKFYNHIITVFSLSHPLTAYEYGVYHFINSVNNFTDYLSLL